MPSFVRHVNDPGCKNISAFMFQDPSYLVDSISGPGVPVHA